MDLEGALNPVTGVYVRKEDTQKQREEGDVKAKAETRVMWPHAKEDGWKKPKMGSPENGRSKDFFLP